MQFNRQTASGKSKKPFYQGSRLDYGPIDAWANGVLASNANRRAIAVTHGILEADGSFDSNRTPTLYDSLKGNANLFLMLCGHNHGEARREEIFDGRSVYLCLSDYQSYTYGGDGLLRLYEFSPGNGVIRVKTYSPRTGRYKTDAQSQFEIPFDMNGPWLSILTRSNVTSGDTVSTTWPDCLPGTRYEWQATASGGVMTTRGPVWSFVTAPGPASRVPPR